MTFSMGSLVLTVLLSMHLNLLPRDEDIFWMLKEYGTWLFGWPTVLLVLALACTCGVFVVCAVLAYPALQPDVWIFLAMVSTCGAAGAGLFITMSRKCWSRINTTSITKIWPGDPWMQHSERKVRHVQEIVADSSRES